MFVLSVDSPLQENSFDETCKHTQVKKGYVLSYSLNACMYNKHRNVLLYFNLLFLLPLILYVTKGEYNYNGELKYLCLILFFYYVLEILKLI